MVVIHYAAIIECARFTAAPSFPDPRTVSLNCTAFFSALFYATAAPSFRFFRHGVALPYSVPNYAVRLLSVQALRYSRPDVALKIPCANYAVRLVSVQEVPKRADFNPNTTFYLWTIKHDQVVFRFTLLYLLL